MRFPFSVFLSFDFVYSVYQPIGYPCDRPLPGYSQAHSSVRVLQDLSSKRGESVRTSKMVQHEKRTKLDLSFYPKMLSSRE